MISIQLPQFEGSLDLLLQLAQKQEVEIEYLSLKEIMVQIFKNLTLSGGNLTDGAESMGIAAHLIFMKSLALLPQDKRDKIHLEENAFNDLGFHHLVEYCLFKDAAKYLSFQEEKGIDSFPRNVKPLDPILPSGLEFISLSELALLFQNMLQKSQHKIGIISEEEWKISDKIAFLKKELMENPKISFEWVFSMDKSRNELIVLFLAVLELMKAGELKVIKDQQLVYLYAERN